MRHRLAAVAGTMATALIATAPAASAAPDTDARRVAHDPDVTLLASHPGAEQDAASTAEANIDDTARDEPARTSTFSDVGASEVPLDGEMLSGMVALSQDEDHSFRVTEIAGGDHRTDSAHYEGSAFDVDVVDGMKVGAANPSVREFMNDCRALGATEVYGPGDPDHDTHVHCAWS